MLSLFPPKENSKQNKKNTHTQTKKPSGADSKQKMRENWTAVCADTDYYNKTESLEECRWMVLVFVIIKKKHIKTTRLKIKKKKIFHLVIFLNGTAADLKDSQGNCGSSVWHSGFIHRGLKN